ncbi:hypothetical protein U8607_18475 [Methylobacterium durans]|uniref:hypothetical protein n=1 Tax=Methylobacterium durans TaxID=2202825 RepID=UPI002AFFBB6E|nr:hypothetical protein [Methylobacterium durans]MEA1834079.1 hypothetical protein [Methylobacterium durans]
MQLNYGTLLARLSNKGDDMTGDERDIDGMVATVCAAAAEAGSHVVEVVLTFNDAKIPVASIDANNLAALIRAIRPRLVYCASIPFNAGDQVLTDLFGDDADEALLDRPRVKRLVAKWRSRDGHTAQASAVVVADGVMHGLLVEAPWYGEYEADVGAHSEETDQLRNERERRIEAEAKKRLDPLVKRLMADTRFAGPKVGHSKRLALACELFPDEDRQVLSEVVDMAENRHWLTAGR